MQTAQYELPASRRVHTTGCTKQAVFNDDDGSFQYYECANCPPVQPPPSSPPPLRLPPPMPRQPPPSPPPAPPPPTANLVAFNGTFVSYGTTNRSAQARGCD